MNIFLTGISSTESFSSSLNPKRTLFLIGISSEEVVSVPIASQSIEVLGIDSEEIVGDIRLLRYYSLTSLDEAVATDGGGPFLPFYPGNFYPGQPNITNISQFGTIVALIGDIPQNIPITRSLRSLSIAERFSNPIINQNGLIKEDSYVLLSSEDSIYQEFRLPHDFTRGKVTPEARTPPLTGFQILSYVALGYKDTATLDWTIERYEVGRGWISLQSATTIGAAYEGSKVWFSVYLDEPIEIAEEWTNDLFRISLRTPIPETTNVRFKEEVSYTNGSLIIDGFPREAYLEAGEPYSLTVDDIPSVVHLDSVSKRAYLSTQYGINGVYTTHPNPLAPSATQAYLENAPLQIDGKNSSLNFRILAGIGEEGTDFLGNRFRSVVTKKSVNNLDGNDSDHRYAYWSSKPNPSKFAVENLYFDISDGRDTARTIDHILIDPSTPGLYFNLYWTSEGDPATSEAGWNNKLWTRIPQTYQALHRFRHPLPQPVTTKYLKIEFTQLQPKWYSPGIFQKPILYNKHPKWVLDYFLSRAISETEDPFVSRRVGVQFDAYDLAYNYYLDDLNQSPLTIAELGPRDLNELNEFLGERTDQSDLVDRQTFRAIQSQLRPYSKPLSQLSKFDYLPSLYALTNNIRSGERVIQPDQQVETPYIFDDVSDFVSSLNRDPLIIENDYPIMYFFITARHQYRQVTAKLQDDKAYFAGINEIAFLRERYEVAYDTPFYIEAAGDPINIERNDFISKGSAWITHE